MIVAGVGCRRGGAAADIETAILSALAQAALTPAALDAIATIPAKEDEGGIAAAAAKLGVALIVVPEAELQAADARTLTRSPRVEAATGLGSVAEAAALAAAGPSGRLIAARLVVGSATCALARSDGAS